MYLRYHTYICSFLVLFFLVSACRNEPKLPPIPKDTEVNVRVSGDPRGLNPLLNYDGTAMHVMGLLYLPLLDFNPETYELEPVLAKSLPIVEEVTEGVHKGLVAYKYEILKEVEWDDGTPITGKDLLFTLKAMYNPNSRSPHVSSFAFVKAVEVNPENPKQFAIYGQKYLIANATIGLFQIMPAHILDPDNVYANYTVAELKDPKNKEKFTNDDQLIKLGTILTSPKTLGQEGELSGSGAYKLMRWEANQSLVLERKDNWWGDKLNRKSLAAIPKKLNFKIVPDFNAARSLFLNEELDIMGSIGISDFESLKTNDFFRENFNFHAPPRFAHRAIILNNTDPRLEDKRVRRALAHLFDLEEVFEAVYLGEKNYVTSSIHPTKPYYRKDLKPIEFNVEKANSLLEEAGWSDSNNNGILDKKIDGQLQELDLRISFPSRFNDYRDISRIFQEGAKQAGVSLKLTPMDSAPFQLSWNQKDYELSFWGISWLPLHKNLKERWHSEAPTNYTGFGTVEADKIIDEIAQTVDEDKLAELYGGFQEIFYKEQPAIMINTASHHIISNKKFGDVTMSAISPGYMVNELKQVTFSNN